LPYGLQNYDEQHFSQIYAGLHILTSHQAGTTGVGQYSEELIKNAPENIIAGCASNRFWLGYDINFLIQAIDETGNPITSGNVRLVIGNYEGGSDFTVAFDNFKVYKH
jgi:hypothetical protein